uniref:CNNM transmembrane domain-containing protein n=1 Tax=Fagus sylvatica TaxID=28930 RepID=A0A2N9EG07_FAGSY
MRMSMKILQRNNRYPFRLASNCMGPCGFNSYFNARYCGKGNNLFVGRAGLMFVGEDCESSSDENAVSGVNLKRVFAMEGVVNAGYGVIGQSILLLRNAWPKTLQVLQVFKDQGLILAALLGLSAFFSMAETSITTLWPWKVRELAEKDSENGVFKTLRSDLKLKQFLIVLDSIDVLCVVNIGATALVTEAATTIFGEAGVSAATGVMTVAILLLMEITPKSIAVHNATEVARFVMSLLRYMTSFACNAFRSDQWRGFPCEPYVTEDELKLMLRGAELSGAIEEEEQDMIDNVLEIKDTHVREVMTPLVDVVAIDASAILIDFHTLVPVFEQRVDNIVGIAYAMDLLDYAQKGELLETTTVGDMAHKPAYFVPGEHSESLSDENAVSGVNLKFVSELVKRGIVLAAMVCGVLVFGCRRVFAMEGVVNAGYGVIGQSILLLRNAWPKTLQVLQVFKDQGLILAALLGLVAFFSMAETSITTLWPWKSNFRGRIYCKEAVSHKVLDILVMDLRTNNFHGAIPDTFVKDNLLTTLVFNALSNLKVLILKSNRFHGPIGNDKTSGKFFTKLRILDLSHNEFIGLLPRNYLQNLNAMMTNDEGEIPEVLGRLTILRLLNLSHNSLTGHIPSSLANLSALESLDLSSNRLTGEIPMQLTSLTFLAKLNLSQNQLTGPIPQGNQFGTFGNDSYDGNLGLCGFPLSFKCGTNESPPPPPLPSIFQEDYDSLFASGFGWKAVLIGYGCGLLFGLAMGYVMFKIVKPQWLVRFVEGKRSHKTRRPNNQRARQ